MNDLANNHVSQHISSCFSDSGEVDVDLMSFVPTQHDTIVRNRNQTIETYND